METTDHVDILFANAGATWGEKFETHPDSAFAKVMDLNVKSVFNTIRLYVLFSHVDPWQSPQVSSLTWHDIDSHLYFRRKRQWRIQPVSLLPPLLPASVLALWVKMPPLATQRLKVCRQVPTSLSCLIKALCSFVAAAIHLTRNLAVELGPRHILCNSIAPGFFPSKMASGLMSLHGGEAQMAKQNPNGRLGRPEDIAGAVVYLASRASSHVNGACITLDGGALWGKGRL